MPRGLLLALLLVAAAGLRARADGEDVKALYDAGVRAEKARDFRKAREIFEKALRIDETYEDLLERSEACEPLAEWQDSLSGEPAARDLVRLGEVLAELRRPQEEAACYEDALEMDPSCTDAHGHLALLHYVGRGFQGSLVTVIRETERLLETSPHHERLARALADFRVYGELRILGAILRKELEESRRAAQSGQPRDAAEILEAALEKDIPDAFRTELLVEAGRLRRTAGDREGARAALEAALRHANCASTMRALLELARLDLDAGDPASALERLRASVREGCAACRIISEERAKAFRALFESKDEAVRAEMERLTDMERADASFRESIDAAVKRAAEEGKLVLLHFYGPYCPYVMAMEERLADPEVRKVLEARFVHVRIDFGSHHRAITIDREYGNVYMEHGVPSFYILDREGSIRSIQKDVPLMERGGRSYSREKILDWLRSAE